MDESQLAIELQHNRIYFYEEVTTQSTLCLIKKLKELDLDLTWNRKRKELPDDFTREPIWLHINTPGGNLFDGLNILDTIQSLKSPVYSVCEGIVASAGTIMSIGCSKRYIRPNAVMLIHQLMGWNVGTHEQMEDGMKLHKIGMKRLYKIYAGHSKLSKKKIKKLLKRDYWMDADEALEKGFVDAILIA